MGACASNKHRMAECCICFESKEEMHLYSDGLSYCAECMADYTEAASGGMWSAMVSILRTPLQPWRISSHEGSPEMWDEYAAQEPALIVRRPYSLWCDSDLYKTSGIHLSPGTRPNQMIELAFFCSPNMQPLAANMLKPHVKYWKASTHREAVQVLRSLKLENMGLTCEHLPWARCGGKWVAETMRWFQLTAPGT